MVGRLLHVQWHKVDSSLDKYKNFGDESIGMEPWVGRAHLDQEVLKQWYEDEEKTASDSSGNIDDSMTEDESTKSKRCYYQEQLDHSQTSEPVNVEGKEYCHPVITATSKSTSISNINNFQQDC